MTQEPAEYLETEDTVSMTIDGIAYILAREITGEQYLILQQKSIKSANGVPTEFQSDDRPSITIDSDQYNHWNLILRLIEPDLTPEQVKALKRKIYHPLALLAARLDAEEARSISDFLVANSQCFRMSGSTLEPFLDSLQVTSEASEE